MKNWCQIAICSLVTASVLAVGGCAGSAGREEGEVLVNIEQVRVEMLYFEGCPNTQTMRERLREAVGRLGDGVASVEVDLESLPMDDARRGYGSPTVLVNGRDLMGMAKPEATELSCRIYPEGVPSSDAIAAMIGDRGR
jgi:hypothetical protein